MDFAGSYVALVSPWREDLSGIDYSQLRDLLEWHIAAKTDGIIPAGTTGESATLSHREQEELIAKTVELVSGRIPVVAGAGSNRTDEAVSLAKSAEASGANALLVITPYYNRPTQEGLYRHFVTIANATSLPLMLYNVPSRTGVNLLPETLVRIAAEAPNVQAIKEASGSVDQTSRIISLLGDKVSVLSGDDSLTVPLMSLGAKGVVSVVANVLPGEVRAMAAAALAGDFSAARRQHYHLQPLMKALFVETNPGPVKAALGLLGKIRPTLRLPLLPPSPESLEVIRVALRECGVQA
ncbi:MAG: 4-hydroxy-tetrahydrodipicolinate synthase [Planctomycetota bacterium]|jgi:4-hydroxy-tetrahydrodipicolinate synthase|nr:4-hydroxy-tetrahydrodipicolinate synthase [Planctomycetota bacterium]